MSATRARSTWFAVAALAALAGGGCASAVSGTAAARGGRGGAAGRATGLSGQVRDRASGAPVAMASVAATRVAPGAQASQTGDLTDSSGRFAIAGLAPGAYELAVWMGNRRVGTLRTTVPAAGAAEVVVDVQLEAEAPAAVGGAGAGATVSTVAGEGGVIAGVVRDLASGQPVEGAVIAVWQGDVSDSTLGLTDDKGRYRVAGLPSGAYRVSCYYRLIHYGSIEVTREGVAVGPGATSRVDLRLDTSVPAGPAR